MIDLPGQTGLRTRDSAIDVLRGGCIVSMVFAHVAAGSHLHYGTHPLHSIDGASGFFLFSGLVLGMVHERSVRRGDWRRARERVLRRTALMYVSYLALALLAVVLVGLGTRAEWAGEIRSSSPAFARATLLLLNPDELEILPVYVMIFLLLAVAFALRRRGHVWPVAAGSVLLYVAAVVWPDALSLPRGDGGVSFLSWGAWQALFFSGYLTGWVWRSAQLGQRLRAPRVVLGAAAVWLVLSVLGEMTLDDPGLAWLYSKSVCGPLRIVIAWAAFIVGYTLLSALTAGWAQRALAPVATLGRHSLGTFVLMSTAVLVIPAAGLHDSTSVAAQLLALAVVAAGWVRAVVSERIKELTGGGVVQTVERRLRARLPSAAPAEKAPTG